MTSSCITDDGNGFDVSKKHSGGMGLASMHHRADSIGGRLTIESRPGRTSVRVSVPAQLYDSDGKAITDRISESKHA